MMQLTLVAIPTAMAALPSKGCRGRFNDLKRGVIKRGDTAIGLSGHIKEPMPLSGPSDREMARPRHRTAVQDPRNHE